MTDFKLFDGWVDASNGIDRPGNPQVQFQILDHFRGCPAITIDSPVSTDQLHQLEQSGFIGVRGLIGANECIRLRLKLDELAELELESFGARRVTGNGYYVRDLLLKDRAFLPFLSWDPMIRLARIMLGPKVRVRVDSRIAFADEPGAGVPWHIHFPGLSEPLPPWFSYPQAMHVLTYFGEVGPDEGPLLVVPGSHRQTLNPDNIDQEQVVEIRPQAGDSIVMHGNLWHRTLPSKPDAARRYVLFVGYTSAWVVGDSWASGQPVAGSDSPIFDPRAGWAGSKAELQELLGEFRW